MRLATWNILHGTSLADGQVDPTRLRGAAGTLRADVLGLQEVDRGQPRSHQLDLVREVAAGSGGVAWRFLPALIGTPGFDWRPAEWADERDVPLAYGVGLVSTLPVLSWHTLRLSAARVRAPVLVPGSRRVLLLRDEPRVALAAVVAGPYGRVTVGTTHLSFVPGWSAVQLRRVVRWLAELPGPQVLLGDLNMPAGVAGLVSRWQVLGRRATYPAPEPRMQLDHILGHGALPPVRSVDTPALAVSDHRPLVVELAAP